MTRGLLGSGGFIVKDDPKAYHKRYYAKNKKHILEKAKERYAANTEKYKKRTRQNYKNKLEKLTSFYKTARTNYKLNIIF